MYSPSIQVEVYFFIGTDLDKCSITSLAHHWILCSEWVPSLVLLDFFHWCFMKIYLYLGQIKIPIKTLMMDVFLTNIQLFTPQDITRWTGVMGVMHSLFLRGHELSSCDTLQPTMFYFYVLFIFSFSFKTFPNTLTISWNILILTFIDYVDLY